MKCKHKFEVNRQGKVRPGVYAIVFRCTKCSLEIPWVFYECETKKANEVSIKPDPHLISYPEE